ncbi:uncharacterized protein [Palaemon carinicauda]|uniref:uncharacterized protein n=1 Tax=Palaemon carinicauda TaxID=392227 RepID=UPI0035B674A8
MPRQHETAPSPSKDKVEPKQCKSAKIAEMSSVDLPCTILPTAMAEINHKQGSLISPLFVRGKLFLQQLWEDNVGWDDVIKREKAREVGELLYELKAVSNITFPREVGKKNLELHVFTDASSIACGAVAYIRDNCNQVKLLTSKMRITPKGMNKLTIPKLELLALLLGCRLAKTLKGLIEPRETVMRTDSKVTLAWVASPDVKDNKNVFICNRVAEIIFLRQVCDFSLVYVPSKQNLADVLSRGATTQQLLQNSLWQKGPEFLTTGEPVPYKEDDPTSVRTVVAAVQELREEIRPVPPKRDMGTSTEGSRVPILIESY